MPFICSSSQHSMLYRPTEHHAIVPDCIHWYLSQVWLSTEASTFRVSFFVCPQKSNCFDNNSFFYEWECRGKSTKQHHWKTYHTESIYTPHWVTRYCPANDNMTSSCDLHLVNQASTKQHLRNTAYTLSTKQHLRKTYHTESIYTSIWVTRDYPANDKWLHLVTYT